MELNTGMWNGSEIIRSRHVGNLSSLDDNGFQVGNSTDPEELQSDMFQHLYFRILLILAYSIVFLCCFFGNLMVMVVVILHRRMRTATNFFLANLALADFCVGIFCVYQNLMIYLLNSWTLGDFLCRMYHFVQGLSYSASILILSIITLERYVVIVHPMWGKRFITLRRLRIALVILWIVSAIYSSPRLILYGTTKVPSWHEENDYYILCVMQRSVYYKNHVKIFDIYNFAFLFAFPILLMIILYTKIAIKLWRSQRLHGEKVNNILCCCGERKSKITRSVPPGVMPESKSLERVPIEEHEDTIIPLHEDESIAVHEDARTTLHEDIYTPPKKLADFESSGTEEDEEEENDNDNEELLEDVIMKKRSIKSLFSRTRYSFTHSGDIQQQRASFRSLKGMASNIVSDEIKPLPAVAICELECPNKTFPKKIENILKEDLRKNNKEKNSEVSGHVLLNEEIDAKSDIKKKIDVAEESHTDNEAIPDDILTPVTNSLRRVNSLQSYSRDPPPKGNLSPIRRGSEPPTYKNSRSTTRRPSETLSYIKSLLRRRRSEDSPGLNDKRRVRRTGSKIIRSRRKIVRVLIVILCAFVICNLPFHARKFWQVFSPFYDGGSNTSLFITLSTNLFFYMNSGINPFLYAFLSTNFRKCIKDVLFFRTHKWTTYVPSPKSSNNSKRTTGSSSTGTSASRGSASSSRT